MGWSGGSEVAEDFILDLRRKPGFNPEQRQDIYQIFIIALQNADWDCQKEVMGIDNAYDAALRFVSPDLFDDKEDDE